jgi:lipoprotein signal peptidase
MIMSERTYRGLLWSLALVGLLGDQTSKYLIFRWLYNDGLGGEHALVPGAFDLLVQYTSQRVQPEQPLAQLQGWSGDVLPLVNHGALFGIKIGMGVSANTVFAVISLVAAAAIIGWSLNRHLARDWALCAALGLILGGTIGNLYDRIVFHGVRDFLHWHYAFDWPVFNIADCCLVSGAFLLLAQAFFVKHEQIVEEPVAQQAAETAA